MSVRNFPFGDVVDRQPAASAAPGATDIFTFTLAYQMMRDAKAQPTRKYPCVAGGVIPIAENAQRKSPVFVRVRAQLDKSVATPYLFLGLDSTQTQAGQVVDRIGHGGQIEFLLYPGQELWACYTGDAASVGDILVSVSTLEEAVTLLKRATGQQPA